MPLRYPALPNIQSHLDELRSQEEDALTMLSRPEPKPGTHSQLKSLLQRIAAERSGLEQALSEVFSAGSRF
jgi:hypothetical protein